MQLVGEVLAILLEGLDDGVATGVRGLGAGLVIKCGKSTALIAYCGRQYTVTVEEKTVVDSAS